MSRRRRGEFPRTAVLRQPGQITCPLLSHSPLLFPSFTVSAVYRRVHCLRGPSLTSYSVRSLATSLASFFVLLKRVELDSSPLRRSWLFAGCTRDVVPPCSPSSSPHDLYVQRRAQWGCRREGYIRLALSDPYPILLPPFIFTFRHYAAFSQLFCRSTSRTKHRHQGRRIRPTSLCPMCCLLSSTLLLAQRNAISRLGRVYTL